nr:MAG TPA: hypothetical protein [Caudoviricetes sp.]
MKSCCFNNFYLSYHGSYGINCRIIPYVNKPER